MAKWLCTVCNIYVYDEERGDYQTGIVPNTKVPDFPDSWKCPVCGAAKDKLVIIPEEEYWQKASLCFSPAARPGWTKTTGHKKIGIKL